MPFPRKVAETKKQGERSMSNRRNPNLSAMVSRRLKSSTVVTASRHFAKIYSVDDFDSASIVRIIINNNNTR